jgi:hypothetical protein
MKELFFNSVGIWGYVLIPIVVGIVISFASEFLYQITPNVVRKRYSLWITTIFFTVLITLIFDNYYKGYLEIILALTFNFFFAWLFYVLTGKTFVVKLMKKISDLINKKIDGA